MAPPAVLSIAGSDSGGGAGIQADLKAFARCGVHGMTAITVLTAQNTTGVTAIHAVPPDFIIEQVRTVHADIGIDAIKIGMLGTATIVHAVREAIDSIDVPIVIDPVMVAESGAVLLDDEARRAIVSELFPLATVITPNVPEARVLAGGDGDPDELAVVLHELGPENVVITGGHRDEITDVFYDGITVYHLRGERHPDGAAHGSGCTHSSALAAHLALGCTPKQAAQRAKQIAEEAVKNGLRQIGRGPGPVNALGMLVSPMTARANPPGRTAPRDIMRP